MPSVGRGSGFDGGKLRHHLAVDPGRDDRFECRLAMGMRLGGISTVRESLAQVFFCDRCALVEDKSADSPPPWDDSATSIRGREPAQEGFDKEVQIWCGAALGVGGQSVPKRL